MPEQIETSSELQEHLAEVLAKWPLFRSYSYTGTSCHETNFQRISDNRYGVLPKELKLLCTNDKCRQETWWEALDVDVYFGSDFIKQRAYRCKNCSKANIWYCFIWRVRDIGNIFVKVGQYPELEERVPDALQQTLEPSDLKLYKNALRLRNFNLGIAAVAYMRRVVENRMSEMLEILHEAAIAHNAPHELLARHEEMKEERRFSVRVDYAGELLPTGLRPLGKPNPMAILHELASDGLHAKSDEECVDIFDTCRGTFEFVFGKLRIETEDAKNFVREMAILAERKAKSMSDARKPSEQIEPES